MLNDERYAFKLRSLQQVGVLRGKCQSATLRQLKVGRIVNGQPMFFAQRKNSLRLARCKRWFHINRQHLQLLSEQIRLPWLDALSSNSHEKSIGNLCGPMRWNRDVVPC